MVLIGVKFQVLLSNVLLIGTKCLVFPQQRSFDWYEANFYDSPSNTVLINAAILHETDPEYHYSCANLDLLTTCLFTEIDAQIYMPLITLFTKAFYQCLHKNLAL